MLDSTFRFMQGELIGSYIDMDTLEQVCDKCWHTKSKHNENGCQHKTWMKMKCRCEKFIGKADLEIKNRMSADLKRLGIKVDEN